MADCCFSVRVSAVFLQYEPFAHPYIDITAPGLSSYVLQHEPPKSICLTLGKRVLSYVLTRCQWFRTFDPLDSVYV